MPPSIAAPGANLWPGDQCAKAFWGQHELPAYRKLLADTVAWCGPAAGETWLDLGCGGGAVTRAVWDASTGQVAGVVGLDCAAVNAKAYARLREELQPPSGDRVRFTCHDFSGGLGVLPDSSFDGCVSGLAVTYAECRDPVTGAWTQAAYDRLLADVFRVLKPGGRFVFSANVPDPSWAAVAVRSALGVFAARRPLRYAQKSWRMLKYGRWLKREAVAGRFHYLPADEVADKLAVAGFVDVEHRLSFVGQAFIFRGRKAVA